MSDRHYVGLLCLRTMREPPIDDDLRNRCALTYEIKWPGSGDSLTGRWFRRGCQVGGLLFGRPTSVTSHSVGAYRRELCRLVHDWQPDVVQIEYPTMGQYASCLNG